MKNWILALGLIVLVAACTSAPNNNETADSNLSSNAPSGFSVVDVTKPFVKETGYEEVFNKEKPACKGEGYCGETFSACKSVLDSANSTCLGWRVNCTSLTNLCLKKFNVTLEPDNLYASYVGTIIKFEGLNGNFSSFSITNRPEDLPCGAATTVTAGSVAFTAIPTCSIDEFGTQLVKLVVTSGSGTKVYDFSRHLSLQQRIQNCRAGLLNFCEAGVCTADLAALEPCDREAQLCNEPAWQKQLAECTANVTACAEAACEALKEVTINPMKEWPVLFKHIAGTCAFPKGSTQLHCNSSQPKQSVFSVKAVLTDGTMLEPFTDSTSVGDQAVVQLEFKPV